MAGRTAKPVLPLGAFYPENCSLLGFAMFNATPAEQAPARRRHQPLVEHGKLKPLDRPHLPLDSRRPRPSEFLEENTIGGAGQLTGKVVISIDRIAG